MARYFKNNGDKVITQKWVQTGCLQSSDDIDKHLKISGIDISLDKELLQNIAPYILSYPSSPHLAAKIDNIEIERSKILEAYDQLCLNFDNIIIEGSGGVLVPFNEEDYLIDIAKELDLSIILISENKLGAINHTLLSLEALKMRGLNVLGIIYNNLSRGCEQKILSDNVSIITKLSGISSLGEVPYEPTSEALDICMKEIIKNIGSRTLC